MTSTASTTAQPGKTFSVDATASDTACDGSGVFRRASGARAGEARPLPGLGIGEPGDLQVRLRAVRAHDVLIGEVHNTSLTWRPVAPPGSGDRVLMLLVRRGEWRSARVDQRGETVAFSPGSFIARRNGPPSECDVGPGGTTRALFLPASVLGPVIGGQQIVGSLRSPEVRILTACADMLGETVRDLTPAGVQGARDALLELARGVLKGEFDDVELRLAPSLARAAMAVADSRLTDPELSPSSLARELNVSVRTLHRAFAAAGESAAAYIRRGRLERARRELAAPTGRLSVSEAAARWHFVDSSHFIRAFKQQYKETPAQFAKSERQKKAVGGDFRHPLV